MMNKEWVNGYKQIEKVYGYWPSFHDDTIEKIEIDKEGIKFIITMEEVPMGMEENPIIKMSFLNVKKFYLDGGIYGCASIILDIETEKSQNIIETKMASSLGARGTIFSKSITVDFCNIEI